MRRPKHPLLIFVIALGGAILVGLGRPWFAVLIACVVAYGILRLGMMMLGGLARPVPEPPPAGELRKVKIIYRCSICGTEVRMTVGARRGARSRRATAWRTWTSSPRSSSSAPGPSASRAAHILSPRRTGRLRHPQHVDEPVPGNRTETRRSYDAA